MSERCPTCGADADPGQLVCLECGSRVALNYRRAPSVLLPIVVVVFALLAVTAGGVLAYKGLEDEAKDEVDATPVRITEKKASTAKRTAAKKKAAAGSLATLPKNYRGYTIVLLSSEEKATADQFARRALKGGGQIGVVDGDGFETLPDGFHIVFFGKYPDQRAADAAAAKLQRRFEGAFSQRVAP